MTDDLDEAAAIRGAGAGKAMLGVGLVVLLLGGGGAAFWWLTSEPHRDPTRVVVVRAGEVHQHFDEPFARAFGRKLEDHGFDVVEDDAPLSSEGDAAIAEARARATAAEAASAVILRFGVDDERAGVLDGQRLYRPHLEAVVVPAEGEPISHASEFAFEGVSALEIASAVQDTWLDTVALDTIDALYRTAAVREIVDGEDLAMDRMQYVVALREKEAMVERRAERIESFAQECRLARQQMLDVAATEEGVTCLGDPCRPWSSVGISPDGQTAYVHEHYREPIVEHLDTGRLRWTEPPEGVYAVPLSGEGAPRALLRVGHFYSLATMRADGSALSAAFFADGTPAVVTLDPATGEWPGRWLLEANERVLRKEPSADRRHALVYRRREGWALLGEGQPVVMPTFDDARLVDFPDGETRVVGVLGSAELAVIGLDADPGDLRIPLEGRVTMLDQHGDRLDIMVREGRQCSVRRFDLAERTLSEPEPLPICLGDVSSLPDGRLLGGARHSVDGDAPGDWEILLVDPADASITTLTKNGLTDELPVASADGSRVLWSRRIGDWPEAFDLELYRRVVCYADLPAR